MNALSQPEATSGNFPDPLWQLKLSKVTNLTRFSGHRESVGGDDETV